MIPDYKAVSDGLVERGYSFSLEGQEEYGGLDTFKRVGCRFDVKIVDPSVAMVASNLANDLARLFVAGEEIYDYTDFCPVDVYDPTSDLQVFCEDVKTTLSSAKQYIQPEVYEMLKTELSDIYEEIKRLMGLREFEFTSGVSS